MFRAHHLACSSSSACISISVVLILQPDHMTKSLLDPHAADLLLRARQGYTQRMLLLYLQHEKSIRLSQPSLSRWLSGHRPRTDLPPDDEYQLWKAKAALPIPICRYCRALAKWDGHIKHLRNQGASLGNIQDSLRQRGVTTSIRSIRRALEALQ